MKRIYKCFPDGKTKALTMSYDDGRESDIKLIKIFDKYKIKGTFHLNTGIIWNKEQSNLDKYGRRIDISNFYDVYKNHEVACHTVNHIPLDLCPVNQRILEVCENRKTLESIMKYTIRGMSYPYGTYNEEIKAVLRSLGIEYSRTVNDTENFSIPDDFLEWNGTCRHKNPNLFNLCDKFLNIKGNNRLNLMYVWGHSYEFVQDDNWDLIENFCSKMAYHDDIWYATNIEIVDYLKAYDNLKFSFDGSFVYNPNNIAVWTIVDDKVYKIKGGQVIYFN